MTSNLLLRGSVALLHLAAALAVTAAPIAAQQKLPAPTGYVNDFANVISAEHEASINRMIEEVRTKSGGEMVVVTLPSLEGEAAGELAMRIGREWKIGKTGKPGDLAKETGLVFLVAPNNRKVYIATGFGTNAFITATEAGRIQDDYVLPKFRNGDFGGGVEAGVAVLAQQYAQRFGFELTGVSAPDTARVVQRRGRRTNFGPIIFILFIIIMAISRRGGRGGGGGGGSNVLLGMILGQMMSGGGRGGFGGGGFGGGGFGGGGGGGGFGGFGGSGGFGGGGAGRSW
ncbi:MAG: TPM domain-containing protein [Longimicrobiales bacterium]